MALDTITAILLIVVLLLALPVTFAGYKLRVFTGAVSSFFAAALWCMLVIADFVQPMRALITLAVGIIAAVVAARVHVVGRFGTVALAVLLVTGAVVANIYTYDALLVVVISVVTIAVTYLSHTSRTALILSSVFSGASLLAGVVEGLAGSNGRTFEHYGSSFNMDVNGTVTIVVLALAFLGGLVVQFRFTAPRDTPSTPPTVANEETPCAAPYAAV